MKKDLTQGNTGPLIIQFALPLIGGALFQQFYNIVDTMIVGQFVGVDALAAVGATGSLMFLILGFTMGITAGFGIPVSQAFGARDHEQVLIHILNAVYLCLIIDGILTLAMHFLVPYLLIWMQTPDSIYDLSFQYIRLIFYGMTCTISYNLLASISRALGDSRTPLMFLIFSSFLNIGLDLFMIIVLKLGVQGAAIATVASQGISAILCFFYMRKKFVDIRFSGIDKSMNIDSCRKLLGIAVPMALQYSITAVGTVILQSAVNGFGTVRIAAITAGQKIQLLAQQPMDQLGAAMATFSAQNLGAKKIDRIIKGIRQSAIMEIIYCLSALIITLLFSKQMALLFVDASNTEVIKTTQQFLMVNAGFYLILGILFLSRNVIQGLGHSAITMLAGLAELIGRCFVALYLSKQFGFNAILLANPIAWIAAIFVLIPTLLTLIKQLKSQNHV